MLTKAYEIGSYQIHRKLQRLRPVDSLTIYIHVYICIIYMKCCRVFEDKIYIHTALIVFVVQCKYFLQFLHFFAQDWCKLQVEENCLLCCYRIGCCHGHINCTARKCTACHIWYLEFTSCCICLQRASQNVSAICKFIFAFVIVIASGNVCVCIC